MKREQKEISADVFNYVDEKTNKLIALEMCFLIHTLTNLLVDVSVLLFIMSTSISILYYIVKWISEHFSFGNYVTLKILFT